MKLKSIMPILICIVIGFFMGVFMINQYNKENIENNTLYASKSGSSLYFIQIGVYNDLESMKNNITDFYNYIYEIEDSKYHAYIGIIKDSETKEKIKEYLIDSGYVIYIKEKYVSNKAFLNVLDQYELLLKETDDIASILTICSQVISKYEELMIND